MFGTDDPHLKDAEAAGRYALGFIQAKRKYERGCSVDVIYTIAVWAFHWAARSKTFNALT